MVLYHHLPETITFCFYSFATTQASYNAECGCLTWSCGDHAYTTADFFSCVARGGCVYCSQCISTSPNTCDESCDMQLDCDAEQDIGPTPAVWWSLVITLQVLILLAFVSVIIRFCGKIVKDDKQSRERELKAQKRMQQRRSNVNAGQISAALQTSTKRKNSDNSEISFGTDIDDENHHYSDTDEQKEMQPRGDQGHVQNRKGTLIVISPPDITSEQDDGKSTAMDALSLKNTSNETLSLSARSSMDEVNSMRAERNDTVGDIDLPELPENQNFHISNHSTKL